jgi:4-diphosphocytidyl-2-C-methyl-D-erythritol kinase
MLCFPNCKINIGLYVTRKREDGYHDIETVFYPVHMRDRLEAVPAAESDLLMSGLEVAGNPEDNLVWKAYQLLQKSYPDKVPELEIYLHKAIPMGAGLGGGSADGAFMLRMLNKECELGLSDEELIQLALQLGSDCPFFILNKPQFATGRGEVMLDVPVDLSGYSMQLVMPQVHVSTGKAFSMLLPKAAAFDLRALHKLSIQEWKDKVQNDFEPAVFQMHPELKAIKEQLYAQGAIYAAMSGTGSTVYGIFPKGVRAEISVGVGFEEFYVV